VKLISQSLWLSKRKQSRRREDPRSFLDRADENTARHVAVAMKELEIPRR
jgi:hypothetical protein